MPDMIQERLRDVEPSGIVDFTWATCQKAADRIDALEKALDAAEVLANEVQDLPDGPYHAMYAALCQYRVAHDELRPNPPTS